MKCLYYLTYTLDSTHKISDGLHGAGVDDWFIHVLSKDEAGLKKFKIHSSNYLEQLDILRFGIIGALGGLVIGLIAAILLNITELFGPGLPSLVYVAIIVGLIAFGVWEGGLTGIASENKKIALFHDDLESGRYLILIYATTKSEPQIKKILEDQHAEAKLVAVDAAFYNPFTGLKRIA